MKYLQLLIVLFLTMFSLSLIARAETNPLIAGYTIPPDAVKRGPFGTGRRYLNSYDYLPPGAAITDKNILATETYYKSVLIERDLFKGGKKHGIQREWYKNGQLKSESPYDMGVMDGTFRQWNDKGQLVAQYEMKNGTGTRRIYDDDGVLVREEHFVNSRNDGLMMHLFEPDYVRSLVTYKAGREEPQSLSFYADDSLKGVSFYILTNYPNPKAGFLVQFNPTGQVSEKEWNLNFDVVTEEEYAKAAAQDKTLPPYYADAQRYKEFVTPEIKVLLAKYRAMPRVKIPLELDAKGTPVLAPQLTTP